MKRSFKISAHKWHSPEYKQWRYKWYVLKAIDIEETGSKLGTVKVTVGYDNGDPEDSRTALYEIRWRTKDDYNLDSTY